MRTHCHLHPTDENALQQLITLLGQVGRSSEIEQWYERFVKEMKKEDVWWQPDAETTALLQRLRAECAQSLSSPPALTGRQKATTISAVESDPATAVKDASAQAKTNDALSPIPSTLDTPLSPSSDQKDSPTRHGEPTPPPVSGEPTPPPNPNPQTSVINTDQAIVIYTPQVQIVVQPSPNETPSGRITPLVVIPSSSLLDSTTKFDITSSIDQGVAVETRWLRGEYETNQANMTEEGNDMDAKKRNSIQKIGRVLGGSIFLNSALGLQPLSLAQRGIKLRDEEFLSICKTEIPIWYRLYYEGHHAEVRNILSACLFRLSTLAERPSRYQQLAGNLAEQAHRLARRLALQRQDFSTALMHAKQAFQYGVIAEDFNLQIGALMSEGYIYDLVEDPESMFTLYQKAVQHCDKAPPTIQRRAYAGLAKAHGFLKQEKEADHFLGLAYDTFPEHPEEEPTSFSTRYNSFTVTNDEVVTWLQLNKSDNAWQACEKIARMTTLKPTERAELLIRQAETSFALRTMDQCCSYIQQAVAVAWELDSDLRYQQAYNVYLLLLGKWRYEKAVKDLAVLFPH